jgi:hypothetical protein
LYPGYTGTKTSDKLRAADEADVAAAKAAPSTAANFERLGLNQFV